MRKASLNDVDQLVAMMTEFYAESSYPVNQRRAAETFAAVLSDDRLGNAWLIQADSHDVGYAVVTFCYSLEYGGLNAVLDDFFVRPAFRGLGLGSAALEEIRAFCASRGIRAIHLETGRENHSALTLYHRVGFIETKQLHMTLKLADPAHVQ